jgi:phosphoribosylpyrophosphate synthetase
MARNILFHSREMTPLAADMLPLLPGWETGMIDWDTFPDGMPNIFIHDARALENARVGFLASLVDGEELFRQIAVLYALASWPIECLRVLIPYFPAGMMDRADAFGQVVTSKAMARIFSAIPPATRTDITILDIHALQEQFYFGDAVRVRLHSALPMFRETVLGTRDGSPVTVAFPDDGARKRFAHDLGAFDPIVCVKVREGEKRIIKIREGDPKGKRVCIVDDLVMSGETMLECARVIRAAGATEVSAYVTHAIFPGDSWRRFEGAEISRFYVTDSCPARVHPLRGRKPFEVLSLAKVLAADLQ